MAKSAIGDYIHWNWENYEQYGVSFNNDSSPGETYAYNQWKSKSRTKLAKKNEKGIIKKMEQDYNDLLAGLTNNPDSFVNKAITTKLKEVMSEQYGEGLGTINFNTLDVSMARIPALADVVFNYIRVDKEAYGVNKKTIQSRIDLLGDALAELKVGTTDYKELNGSLKKIKKEIKNLVNRVNTTVDDKGNKKSSLSKTVFAADGTTLAVINQINGLLKKFVATPSLNKQKGDLLEAVTAIFAITACASTESEIVKKIDNMTKKDLFGGQQGGKVIVKKSNIVDSPYLKRELGKTKIRANKNGNYIFADFAQGKGDGYVSIQDDVGGFRPAKFSAKNVKRGADVSEISILGGMNMLSLLSEHATDAANHYLNATTEHPDANARTQAAAAKAHKDIKYLILIQALLGRKTEAGGRAELFIVNDNTKIGGGVKIFEMADIVERVLRKNSDIDSMISVKLNTKLIDTIVYENPFRKGRNTSDGISRRIALLQSGLANQKITAALKRSAWKD